MLQILHDTNIDFMSKRKMWMAISAVLVVLSIAIIAVRGINMGVEFKGGTELQIKYVAKPDVGQVRAQLDAAGFKSPTVTRIGAENENEIYIRLASEGASANQTEKGQGVVSRVKEALRPADLKARLNEGSVDLNETDANTLQQLLALAPGMDPARAQQIADHVLELRKEKGVLTSVAQVASAQGMTPEVMSFLEGKALTGPFAFRSQSYIGPTIGAELVRKAITAIVLSMIGMLIYIAFRFQVEMGIGAVVALIHDTIITLGIFALFGKEMSLPVVAAFLTLVGYSTNDTVVIFDRIRENLKNHPGADLVTTINHSVNQTLSRTILTSGLTWLTVLSLWLFGGEPLEPFAFVMVVGILVGTYSSVYIASPYVLLWQGLRARRKAAGKVVPAAAAAAPARRATKVRKASGAR
ncbi:MAG TPA: protein translocase subunit SecF [Candidatus Polarisedimenticolaceae bacterium]|nr:protein translocase subunit SecF [Candidatus Polarisedimenticolaceae bacterium]